MATAGPEVTVYYDGLCHLCTREINHQRNLVKDDSIAFVDITGGDFDAAAHGLDAKAVNRHMHVKLAGGEVKVGIDAFLATWSRLPYYRRLAAVIGLPGVKQLSELGYAAFARIRPLLPKRRRRADCATGACPR